MAKKPDLAEALRQASGRTVAPERLKPSVGSVRADRQNTKTIAGHFEPGVSRQLKQLALDRDTTVQELLREALTNLFDKYGMPRLERRD